MMTLRETLDLVPDFRSSQGRRHACVYAGLPHTVLAIEEISPS